MRYINALGITSYDIGCMIGIIIITCIITAVLGGIGSGVAWFLTWATGNTVEQGIVVILFVAMIVCIIPARQWLRQTCMNYHARGATK